MIPPPTCLSKSLVKALGCPHHFAHYHLVQLPVHHAAPQPLALVGSHFHAYRQGYIRHLIESDRQADAEWIRREWLAHRVMPEDARQLIESDLASFRIDPDRVVGVELFLSADAALKPLEKSEGGEPGRISAHPDAYISGTLDLLLVDRTIARIVDYKSGWSTTAVSDYELPSYAALVFAHFPSVEVVEGIWEFIRVRATKSDRFLRDDLPWITERIQEAHLRLAEIARRFDAGEALEVNPAAGLCGFCSLACPLHAEIEQKGGVDILPVQTERDARMLAQRLYVASLFAEKARAALRIWLAEHGSVDLGNDWVAELQLTELSSYPLVPTLNVLGLGLINGFGVPAAAEELTSSPRYGIPIDRLALRTTQLKTYAKAKKRLGLAEELDGIAETKPISRLRIRRLSGPEAGRLLDSNEEA